MVNHRVEEYIYWTKRKPILEEIVSNQDRVINAAKQSDPNSQEFQQLQKDIVSDRRTIISVRAYCQSTFTSTSQRLLETADAITEKAASTIKQRYHNLLELEPTITASLEQWAESLLEERLTALFQAIKVYANTTYFDPKIHGIPQKPNPLYVDLVDLSIIADAEKARAYWNDYLNIETVEEFEDFRKEFDEEYISRVLRVRGKLQKKYCSKPKASSLPVACRQVISAEPLAAFRDLHQEVAVVGKSPAEYFLHKEAIEEEIRKTQQQIDLITTLTLSPRDIATLVNLDYTERVYDAKRSIMIDRSIKRYQAAMEKLEEAIEHKKACFQQEIERHCCDINEKISKIYGASDLSVLGGYETEITELQRAATILKNPVQEQRTGTLYRRIKEIREYYTSSRNIPAVERDDPEKKAIAEEVSDTEEASDTKQSMPNEPRKKIPSENKEDKRAAFRKIESPQELTTYAFRSLTRTQGKVYDFCALIAGYQRGNFCSLPLKERVKAALENKSGSIRTEKLTADEQEIYCTIYQAAIRFT